MPPGFTPPLGIAEMIMLRLSTRMAEYKTLVERHAIVLIGAEGLPQCGDNLLRALGVVGRDRPTGRPLHMRSFMALMRRHHVEHRGYVLAMFAAHVGKVCWIAIRHGDRRL